MTILFPDVSQYNATLPAGDVVIARASIGTVKDTRYDTFKAAAAARGSVFTAYHFLNAPSLGVSAAAQANFAFSVIGPGVPTMLDLEPNRGACASLADGLAWVARFRALGGTCHLCYLPKWSWQKWMGSPDLNALTRAGVGLVSSNYTTYSDRGPGWAPYAPGQPVPVQWQFTNNFAGSGADGNAYKGTVADYLALVTGTASTPTAKGLAMIQVAQTNGPTIVLTDWATWCDRTMTFEQLGAMLPAVPRVTVPDAVLQRILALPQPDKLAAQTAVAPTQDQVNAAVLAAMLDARVQKGIGDAIAAHLKVS